LHRNVVLNANTAVTLYTAARSVQCQVKTEIIYITTAYKMLGKTDLKHTWQLSDSWYSCLHEFMHRSSING